MARNILKFNILKIYMARDILKFLDFEIDMARDILNFLKTMTNVSRIGRSNALKLEPYHLQLAKVL